MNLRPQANTHNLRIILVSCFLSIILGLFPMPKTYAQSNFTCPEAWRNVVGCGSFGVAYNCLLTKSAQACGCTVVSGGFSCGNGVFIEDSVRDVVPTEPIEEVVVVGTQPGNTDPYDAYPPTGTNPGVPPSTQPSGEQLLEEIQKLKPKPESVPEKPVEEIVVTDVPPIFSRIFSGLVWYWVIYQLMLDMFAAQAWDHYGCTGNSKEYFDAPTMIKWTFEQGYQAPAMLGGTTAYTPPPLTPQEVETAVAEAREEMENQMRADGNLSYYDGAYHVLSECVRL